MAKADLYRAYAEECFRLAGTIAAPSSRALMLEMARTWHRLAQAEEWKGQVPEACGSEDKLW